MLPFAAATAGAVALLLAGEARDSRALVWFAKPLASAGFVATALAAGAIETRYGRIVLVALCLCWLGDVLLIPRSRAVFRLGILSFLLGHVAFLVGFLDRGIAFTWALAALVFAAGSMIVIVPWLRPHLPAEMRGAVYAYVAVISAMVVSAAGAAGAGGPVTILVGALAFYLSDLSVARDRFVAPGFENRAWGLPLYYAAQLVLASTVK